MREAQFRSTRLAKRLRRTMTNAEVILWSRLRRDGMNGVRFRRQHPIGPYVADFACVEAGLVVEIDGATHHTDDQRAHDARRSVYLAASGWKEVRFANAEIYGNLDSVLDAIWHAARPNRR